MSQEDRPIRPGDRVVEVVQVERVWFACNRPGHKHATEQGARGCMQRHGPPTKPAMAKQDRDARTRAIVDARRRGATLREAGALFGLGAARAAAIIDSYERQCRERLRRDAEWRHRAHRIAAETEILIAATEVVDDALRMWAQQGVHTREHAAYAAMDYLSRLSR